MKGKIVALMALGYLCANGSNAHAGYWDFDRTSPLFNVWSNASYQEVKADALDEKGLNIGMSIDVLDFVNYPFVWKRYSPSDNAPDSTARHVFLFGPVDMTAAVYSGSNDMSVVNNLQYSSLEDGSGNRHTFHRGVYADAWRDAPFNRQQGSELFDSNETLIYSNGQDQVTLYCSQKVYNRVYGQGSKEVSTKTIATTSKTIDVIVFAPLP